MRFKRVKVPIQFRNGGTLVVDGWGLDGINAAAIRAPYIKRGAWQVVRATDGCIFVHADSEAKARAALRKLTEAVADCDAARELSIEAADLLLQVRQQLIEEGLAY